MRYSIIWTDDAFADLKDIAQKIKHQFGAGTARKFVTEIRQRIDLLKTTPQLGTKHHIKDSDTEYYVLHSKKNRIFYDISDNIIYIDAVWDNRRDDRHINIMLTQRNNK